MAAGAYAAGAIDVLTGVVDAAIVLSNDSDLEFPLKEARLRIPIANSESEQGSETD